MRFPEFNGDWVKCKVGDFCSFSKGKGVSKSDIAADGALPCIRYGELYTHYGVKIDEVASRTNVPAEALVLSKGGEVIIPASGETPEDISTAAVVIDCGVALGGDLNILRTKSDGYFLASYISGKARLRLASMAQGNSVVHLYGAQIASLEMCLPSLPEQQKIASFLSSVDKKIDLLRQKKDALERFKKGLMQKIFSQEIRFKRDDGSDFPDWEEVALGDVASVTKGKQLNRDTLTLGAAYPVINGGVTPSGYHDEFNTEENSITISEGGNSCGYVDFQRQKFWCGGHCYVLEPTGEVIDKKFAFQLLKYRQEDIMRLRVGSGLPNIQKGDLLKLAMVIPPELDEQKKIASFLSVVDTKIQKTSLIIEQMETFKKGLLQQMFV